MDLTRYLLYLFIFFIPLMKLPKFAFMGNKLQYCDLLFIPLFIVCIIKIVRYKIKPLKDGINALLMALILISVISFFCTPFKKEVYLDTLGLVYLISIYFVLTSIITDKETLAKINLTLLISTVLVSLLGIIFFVLYNFLHLKELSPFMYGEVTDMQTALLPFYRSTSLLSLPEMFVNFTLLGLACMFIYRLSRQDMRKKTAVDFCIIVVIAGIFLAFSRSAIGLVLIFSAILFQYRNKKPVFYFLFIVCLCLFVFLFLSAAILWFYTIAPVSFSVDKNNGMAQLAFNTNWDTRFYLAKAALSIANKYPLSGLGLGSFTNNFSSFLSREDLYALAARRKSSLQLLHIDPHSLYFGALAEIGWAGLIILLAFSYLLLSKLWKASKSAHADTFPAKACFIFFFVILGYLINGLFVDVLSMRSLWVALSLGVTYANVAGKEPDK